MHIIGNFNQIKAFLDTQAEHRQPGDAAAAYRFRALVALIQTLLNVSGRRPEAVYINDTATQSMVFYPDGKLKPIWSESFNDWVLQTRPLKEEPVGPH